MADKPKKNKNNKRFRHKNYLWNALSADQKARISEYLKSINSIDKIT